MYGFTGIVIPPLLVHPAGTVERLEVTPEALLGTGTRTSRSCQDRRISPGSSIVFYTDGLVERPGEDLDVGLDRLAATIIQGVIGQPPDPEILLDHILDRMPPGHDDDTAILVVRLG